MIKTTVCYDSSPALHIAEARVIELPSGTSLAQFLMAFLSPRGLFSSLSSPCAMLLRRDCDLEEVECPCLCLSAFLHVIETQGMLDVAENGDTKVRLHYNC